MTRVWLLNNVKEEEVFLAFKEAKFKIQHSRKAYKNRSDSPKIDFAFRVLEFVLQFS